jgi:putative Mg2+ transporter-C (MgtC) family protein
MEIWHFIANTLVAMLLGVAIGLERQFRQHPAGLRTNTLVALGAALFVSLSRLMDDSSSPTRIASYIVSGLGFLGGGVILREGFNVRGLNTAATLWCTGAVGTLAGAGFPGHAAVGAAAILMVHVTLRPVVRKIDAYTKMTGQVETLYQVRCICEEGQTSLIRTILMRHINSLSCMTLHGLLVQETDRIEKMVVVADIYSTERSDKALNEMVSRLGIEPSVSSASWERLQ